MSRSLSLDMPEGYLGDVGREMRAFTEKSDPEQFPLIRSYLDQAEGRFPASHEFYEFLVRMFVRGLIAELDLSRAR